ncbi:MAG: epimerase [Pseudomonadota bacterium]|jgi:glucose-6-phosphate 1-epimerase
MTHYPKEIKQGNFQGFPALLIDTDTCTAAISEFGAHLMSYVPKHNNPLKRDLLWLSHTSKKPPEGIRGGVPICWPWFAKQGQSAEALQHGLVRRIPWHVDRLAVEDDAVLIQMSPIANPSPLAVALHTRVGKTCTQTLITHNHSADTHTLTQALHTYFAVGDVRQISVRGLDGLRYSDKFAGMIEKQQEGEFSLPSSVPESDRIYHATGGDYVLNDPSWARQIFLRSEHSRTLVVWNAGPNHVKNFTDIDHHAWPGYMCLEVANAGEEIITLPPGHSARLTHHFGLL